jgi:DNA-binding MarR family transcriptional regulator
METRELVVRERCSTDLRGCVVAITPRAAQLVEETAPGTSTTSVRCSSTTSRPDELEVLATVGDKVRARLAALGRPH